MFLYSNKKKLTELTCLSDEIREKINRANLQIKRLSSPFMDTSQVVTQQTTDLPYSDSVSEQ